MKKLHFVVCCAIFVASPVLGLLEECPVDANGETSHCHDATADLPNDAPAPICRDLLPDCASYTKEECISDFPFLQKMCAETCKICSNTDPDAPAVQQQAKAGGEPFRVDRLFCTEPQELVGVSALDTYSRFRATEEYMYQQVYVHDDHKGVRQNCQLRHKHCTFWAQAGECENNRKYMQTTCAPACFSCRSIDFDYRCPLDKNGYTALAQPGDLHAMFERILTDPQFEDYQPVALSRPSNATTNDAPYILQLDNVLSAEECETMIQLGADRGYKNSTEVGGTTRFDGKRDSTLSERRTSQTTWCKNECGADHVTQAVTQRLEALTGIGERHYEYFQLLKYDVGQHYVSHNDYLPHQVNRRQGVRMLTAYMYLNEVDAGGGTRFASLNLTVTPKPGRLILWPSVLDADTSAEEGRTNHEALPVEKGIKYGTNAWIHQRDYKTPHEEGCA